VFTQLGSPKLQQKMLLLHFIQNGQKGQRMTSNKYNFSPQGDSGGPLIFYYGQQPIQVGVLEYGQKLCGYNVTAISAFISVSIFRPWIDHVLSHP
jgi:secreted trypsin-like serine protease